MSAHPTQVTGIDHLSLPMQDTDAMVAFYQHFSFEISQTSAIVSVHIGQQMINFHRPEVWPQERFTLRAPSASPPCGDICFVWEGSPQSLAALISSVGAVIEEGPVERIGGRRARAMSVYTRDPDGNLLEFMIYDTQRTE